MVKARQGRKASTLVTGFEPFFLEGEEMADELRRMCACATSGMCLTTCPCFPANDVCIGSLSCAWKSIGTGSTGTGETDEDGDRIPAAEGSSEEVDRVSGLDWKEVMLVSGIGSEYDNVSVGWERVADDRCLMPWPGYYFLVIPASLNAMTTTAVLFAVPYADLVVQSVPSCLANTFYGIHGEQAIFKPTACVVQSSTHMVAVPLPVGNEQLVWIQESTIDDALRTTAYDVEVEVFFQWLRTDDAAVPPASDYQTVLLAPEPPPVLSLLHHDPILRSALVAVPDDIAAHALSTFLPRYWKASPIPSTPVAYRAVPEDAVDYVRELLASSHFDPVVASIVNGISVDGMRKDIRYLTNEDGTSGLESRHSFSSGSRVAAAWLKEQFEHTGATCELKSFLVGFAPNVVW